MDKIRIAFGRIRVSSWEERGSSYCFSHVIGWFELIAITIPCLSCNVHILKVLNVGVSCAFMIVLLLCRRGA